MLNLDIIAALQLEKAPSDTARAFILDALASYGRATGLPELVTAATAALPAAHPLRPPSDWRDRYLDTFRVHADEDCGVDADEAPRFCVEYWQSLTDHERQARLATPSLGLDDGKKDAEALNEA